MFKKRYALVNVGQLSQVDETDISAKLLVEHGMVKKLGDGLKVLGEGEVKKPLTVRATRFSASAKEKIEKAGGKAIVV